MLVFAADQASKVEPQQMKSVTGEEVSLTYKIMAIAFIVLLICAPGAAALAMVGTAMMPNRINHSTQITTRPPPCINVTMQPITGHICLPSLNPSEITKLQKELVAQNQTAVTLDISEEKNITERPLRDACRKLKPKKVIVSTGQLMQLFPRHNNQHRLQIEGAQIQLKDRAIDPDWNMLETTMQARSSRKALVLSLNIISTNVTQAIAQALPSSSISALSLNAGLLNDDEFAPIIQALPNSKLKILKPEYSELTSTSVLQLVDVLPKTELTRLILTQSNINDTGGVALAGVLPNCNLEDISLWNSPISDQTLIALGQVLQKSKLRTLNVMYTQAEAAGYAGLAKGLPGSSLESLSVSNKNDDMQDMIPLFEVLPNSNITHLTVGSIDQASSIVLGKTLANVTKLSHLVLADGFGSPIIEALPASSLDSINFGASVSSCSSCNASSILAEVLPKTKIQQLICGSGNLTIIAAGLPGSNVRSFSYYGDANDYDAQALAAVLSNTTIEDLDISGNFIGDTGLEAIFGGLPATKIKKLNAGYNRNSDTSLQKLAQIIDQTALEEILLPEANMQQTSALQLAKNLPKSKVKILNLASNSGITSEAAAAIIRSIQNTKLIYLNLNNQESFQGFQDSVTLALAAVLPSSQLKTVHLINSHIQSAYELPAAIAQSKLEVFWFSGNNVPDAGIMQIAQILPKSNLTAVGLASFAASSAATKAVVENFINSNMTTLSLIGGN